MNERSQPLCLFPPVFNLQADIGPVPCVAERAGVGQRRTLGQQVGGTLGCPVRCGLIGRRLLNGSGIGLVEIDENGVPWRIRPPAPQASIPGIRRSYSKL